jgi:predicted RNA-binding Zn-ribbon protein involved in translation (DUF1610 family)
MHKNSSKHYLLNKETYSSFEKIYRKNDRRYEEKEQKNSKKPEKQFRCVNCGTLVSTNRELAGVNNRNHCPNCLWSRHVDEYKPGDRKATCAARMQPVGLTVKKVRKKYAENNQGELMLIHRCTGCGKVSINRIASDDSTGALITLYQQAEELSNEHMLELAAQGIHPLAAADLTLVFSQLFGWQSILDEFKPELTIETIKVDVEENDLN